jgi:glycosyltransferase involved in cell wall biosynthesis
MADRDAAPAAERRVAIIGPSGRSIARLRGGLIRDLIQRHHKVLALAPDMRSEDAQGLIALGCEAGGFALRPEGFSLFPGRAVVLALANRLKQWEPFSALIFGSSMAPLAVAAARRAGVVRTVLILNEMPEGGLGHGLTRALKSAGTIVAHNRDDYRMLIHQNFNSQGRKVIQVPGAGADLASMGHLALPGLEQGIVFLMAARLDKEKGAQDFCEAARTLKGEGVAAEFLLAGPDGTGEGAMKPDDLSKYSGHVEFLGDASNLRQPIGRAHVFVAPSHREGMPHAVQQAMAAARPVIVSDIPGARETVDEMVNGLMISPSDPKSLADAMRRIVKHKDLLPAMGRASRAKAERLFDATAVNAALRAALELA